MSRPKVTTLLICLGLFLLFFVIRLPFQAFKGQIFSRIYKETGIYIVSDDIYLSLFGWPGIGMRNVEATIPLGNRGAGPELDIACERMVFRVGLAGLFPPTPSISVSATKLKRGGDLYFKGYQTKTTINGTIETDAVNVEQFFTQKDQAVQGKITVTGALTYDDKDVSKSNGKLDITVEKLKTPGQNYQGIIFPNIGFGTLKTKLQIRNGMVEINSFTFGAPDSDLEGAITGDIKLGKTLMSSFLNLTLKIQMKDAFRDQPTSQTLVSLLNGIDNSKPGTYAMRWSTSIDGILSNLWNALPKKVSY